MRAVETKETGQPSRSWWVIHSHKEQMVYGGMRRSTKHRRAGGARRRHQGKEAPAWNWEIRKTTLASFTQYFQELGFGRALHVEK
jgi:hypothetical protein